MEEEGWGWTVKEIVRKPCVIWYSRNGANQEEVGNLEGGEGERHREGR